MLSYSADTTLKEQLRQTLETRILNWYDNIFRYVSTRQDWFPYVKNYDVTLESNRSISIRPVIAYVPRISPFISITYPNGQHIAFKEFFDVSEKVIQLIRSSNIEIPYEPQVRGATREMILIALEARQLQLPSREEIKKRIIDNLDHLVHRSIKKTTRVRSVAPVIGCEFDDFLLLDDVTFRKPTEQDLAAIMLAQGKFFTEPPMGITLFGHPVLVVDHEVDMQPDPHRYSFEESASILHNSFKEHVRDALFMIRLGNQDDVGFGSVFHIDSEWATPESLRLVTEEPYPTYKTVVAGTGVPRLKALLPQIAIQKQAITDIFNALKTVRSKADKTSCSHLDTAIRRFDLALGRDTPENQLIDLIIAFEALAMTDKELAFRLSLWTAVLVGSDNKSRSKIFEDMREAYDLRSQIVHGIEKPDEEKVRGCVSRTKSHLRSVLRKLLSILPEKSLEKIKDGFEAEIFQINLARAKLE